MSNASYKAADMLAGQSLNVIGRDATIAVGTLSDVNAVETSSAFGRMVAEQVGARFTQLGYNVSEIKLRSDISVQQTTNTAAAGEYVFSRDRMALAGLTNARAVVSGTYAVAGENVLVNLRMVDTSTSRVLGAYDYTLPLNNDIRRLVQVDGGQTGIFSSGWAQ